MKRLSHQDIQARLSEATGWRYDGSVLSRQWRFADFREAVAFVNRVAGLAEALDHHPDILIRYHTVQLTLTTHSVGGVTEKDLQLAARINRLE